MPPDPLPISLSQASGLPFYRQVVDQVSALIHSGELPPGALLPGVRQLAADLLVSLITVRRAYADLEAAGLVVRRQGQGTFVREEVDAAAVDAALAEAREGLLAAVLRARQLGLSDTEQRAHLDTIWEDGDEG